MGTALGLLLAALNWVINDGGWKAAGLAIAGVYGWRMWAEQKGKGRAEQREQDRIADRKRAREAGFAADDVEQLDDGELGELLMVHPRAASRRADPVRDAARRRARAHAGGGDDDAADGAA